MFRGEKSYFMSATYDDYQKRLLKQTFMVKESDILVFKNYSTLLSGVKQDNFFLDSTVLEEVDELKKTIIDHVDKEIFEHPFIVFMAKQDEQFINDLR